MEKGGVSGSPNNSVTANCSNNSNSTSYSASSSSSSGSGSGRGGGGSSSEHRKVYCPQCKTLLIEPPLYPIYSCSNCSQLLIAKHALRKSFGTGSVPASMENQPKEEDRSSVDGQSSEILPAARQLHHNHDGTAYDDTDEGVVLDFNPNSRNSKVRQSLDRVMHTSPTPSNPISTQDQYNATASTAAAECSVSTQLKETHDGDSLTKDGSFSDREKHSRDDSFHFDVPAAVLSSSEQMDMVALSLTESGILHRPLECEEDDGSDRVESEGDCVSRGASLDDWNQHGTLRTSLQQLEDPMDSIAISEEAEEDEGTDCDTNDGDENEDEAENEDEDEDDEIMEKVNDADNDDGFLDRIQEPVVFPILSAMGGNLESLEAPLEGAGYGLKAPSETEKISPAIDSPHLHLERKSDAQEAIPESSVDTSPRNSPPKVLPVISPELSSNSFKGTGADNSVLPSKDSRKFLFNIRSEPEGNLAGEESNINQPNESSNMTKSSSEPQIGSGRDMEEFISPDEAEPKNIHNFDPEMNAKKDDIKGSSLPSQTQQSLNLNCFVIGSGDIDPTNCHLPIGSPRIQQHPTNNLSEGGGFAFHIDSEPGSSAEEPNNNEGTQLKEYQSKSQILNHQVQEELVSPDEGEPEDIYKSGRCPETNTIVGDINGSLPLNPHQRLNLNLNPPHIGGIDHLQHGLPHIQRHPQQTQQSLNLNRFVIGSRDIDPTNYHLPNGLPRIQQHPTNNLSEGGGFAFYVDSEPGSSAEEPNSNEGTQLSKPQILNHQVQEELVSLDEGEPEDLYKSGRCPETNTIVGDINGSLPLNPHQRLNLNLNPPHIRGIDHLRHGLPHIQRHPQQGRHRNSGEYHSGRPAERLYPLPNREPQSRGSRQDHHFRGGVPSGQREEVVMGNSRDRNAYPDGFYHHRSSELNDSTIHHSDRLLLSNRAPQGYMPVLGFPALPTTHPPHAHHYPLQSYPHQSSSICALCIPHQHHTPHEASHCQCTTCISYLLSMQQQQNTAVILPPPQQQQRPQYWSQAPLYHPDSSAVWIGSSDSLAGKRLVEMRPKHRRRHYPCLPKTGAAPFVLCQYCFQLLQVPARLSHLSGDITIQKLCCSACMKISKFSVDGFEEVDEMGSHRSPLNNSRRNPSFMRSSSWLSQLNSDMLASSSGHSSPSGSERFCRTEQEPPRGGRKHSNAPNHGSCRKNAEISHMYVNNAEEIGSSQASSTRGSFKIHPNPQMSRVSHASALHASSSNRSNLRSKQLVTTTTPPPMLHSSNRTI